MTSATRQRARRERLTKAAQAAGFQTIDQLAQAILRGEVIITKGKPHDLPATVIRNPD